MMIVCWRGQRREMKVNLNDGINDIEKAIGDKYELQGMDELNGHQIQFYHSDYQKFIDLFSQSLNEFQQLLRKLATPQAPPKSTKEWVLKIVERTVQSRRMYCSSKD